MSGPAVKTLLLRTVVPSVSSAEVPVMVILPKALSMTLVTRTYNKMHWSVYTSPTCTWNIIHFIYKISDFFTKDFSSWIKVKWQVTYRSLPHSHILYMITNECIFFTNYFQLIARYTFVELVWETKNISWNTHVAKY